MTGTKMPLSGSLLKMNRVSSADMPALTRITSRSGQETMKPQPALQACSPHTLISEVLTGQYALICCTRQQMMSLELTYRWLFRLTSPPELMKTRLLNLLLYNLKQVERWITFQTGLLRFCLS